MIRLDGVAKPASTIAQLSLPIDERGTQAAQYPLHFLAIERGSESIDRALLELALEGGWIRRVLEQRSEIRMPGLQHEGVALVPDMQQQTIRVSDLLGAQATT
jgi:hypothetical protein